MNGARAPGWIRCVGRSRATAPPSERHRGNSVSPRVPPFNGSPVDAEPRFKISFRLALFRADISFHSSNVYGVVTNQLPLPRGSPPVSALLLFASSLYRALFMVQREPIVRCILFTFIPRIYLRHCIRSVRSARNESAPVVPRYKLLCFH